MIFSRLYYMDLDCSKYNMKINETITVTVTVTDFNEIRVPNIPVSLTCTGGTLSSQNGLTNRNGQFIVTYTSSDWGVHSIGCDDEVVQINVRGGWKDTPITINNTGVNTATAQYNQDMVKIYLQGTFPSSNSPTTLATLTDTNFAPSWNYSSPSHTLYGQVTVRPSGSIESIINSQNVNYWGCYYPRK